VCNFCYPGRLYPSFAHYFNVYRPTFVVFSVIKQTPFHCRQEGWLLVGMLLCIHEQQRLLYPPSERSEPGEYTLFTFMCLCVCAHSVQNYMKDHISCEPAQPYTSCFSAVRLNQFMCRTLDELEKCSCIYCVLLIEQVCVSLWPSCVSPC